MTAAKWREQYTQSVERAYWEYTKKNEGMPVKTRQLTQAEIEKIFGDNGNPNAIKDIII